MAFTVTELLSSEVWGPGVFFFQAKNFWWSRGEGDWSFACVWNSSWGAAELLAPAEGARGSAVTETLSSANPKLCKTAASVVRKPLWQGGDSEENLCHPDVAVLEPGFPQPQHQGLRWPRAAARLCAEPLSQVLASCSAARFSAQASAFPATAEGWEERNLPK